MRTTLVIVIAIGICLFTVSCNIKTKKDKHKNSLIDPSKLTPGPIQHKNLSQDQLTKIKSIQKSFEEVYPVTLEETITNFKRDLNIDKEINLWLKMKETFEIVLNEKKFQDIEQKKEVFKVILMRTMMPKNNVISDVNAKKISETDIEYILNEFDQQIRKLNP